jgi:hypothetical protein
MKWLLGGLSLTGRRLRRFWTGGGQGADRGQSCANRETEYAPKSVTLIDVITKGDWRRPGRGRPTGARRALGGSRHARHCGEPSIRQPNRPRRGRFAADLPADRAPDRTGWVWLSASGNAVETPAANGPVSGKTTMSALGVTASHASQREPGQTGTTKSTTWRR